MYLVREVLHCHSGKVGQLAKKFRDLGALMREMGLEPYRLYTDLSGQDFWTLILQREYESLDEVVALESRVMGEERAQAIMSGYQELIRRGHREIYRVAA